MKTQKAVFNRTFLLSMVVAVSVVLSQTQTAAQSKRDVPAASSEAAPSLQECVPRSFGSGDIAATIDKERERVRKRIEMIRIWRLTAELDLDEESASRLFPILKEYEMKKAEILAERSRIQGELANALRMETRDQEKLRVLLESYKANETKKYVLYRDKCRNLEEILSPEQLAKYVLFGERFNTELQLIFRDAMTKAIRYSGPQPSKEPVSPPQALPRTTAPAKTAP